jgi:hypothetical protein
MNNLTWSDILTNAEHNGATSFIDQSIKTDSAPLFTTMLSGFMNRGWKLPDEEKMRLPRIIFSDEIVKVNGINGEEINQEFWGHMELLGCYRQNPTFQDWNHEGEIVIYVEKIRKVAERYDAWRSTTMIFLTNDMKQSGMSTFQVLLEIVMAHEVTHWIMHWFTSPSWIEPTHNVNGFIPFNYSTAEEIYFHETVAQLCTWFTIKEWYDIEEVFRWLMTGQPEQYCEWESIETNGVAKLPHIIKLMEAFRETQCQNFEVLSGLAHWEVEYFYPFFSQLSVMYTENQKCLIKNRLVAFYCLDTENRTESLQERIENEYGDLYGEGEMQWNQYLRLVQIGIIDKYTKWFLITI